MSVDLPAFGKPDEPDIGEQLQLQPQVPGLAGNAGIGAPRGAVRGRREARVPAAALAAGGDAHLLAGLDQIGNLDGLAALLGHLVDDRADGHLDDEVLAVAAVHVRSHAVLAASRP